MKSIINRLCDMLLKKKIILYPFILALSLFTGQVNAQFVHTQGTKVLDENGNELKFKGMNLGNWLLWEGYLMMGEFEFRTHTQFLNSLSSAFGGNMTQAKEFERQWRLNYVTEQTIIDLKGLGFNSVRVPFHYNMFWQNGQLSDEGFVYFDNLVKYCKAQGVYIVFDMHSAPGYQNPGDHSDNVDSNSSQPRNTVKFWDGNNVAIASQVWRHIAEHYANEPIIWGYDLLNEPVPQAGRELEMMPAYIKMRNAIREVDTHHIIVAEGNWWGSDMSVLDWKNPATSAATNVSAAWDSNLVYETHHYVFGNAAGINDLNGRSAITNNLGVPLFLGEYGEDTNTILRAMTDWAINNTVGYFPWSFKKMYFDKTLWTVQPNDIYSSVKSFIKNGGTPPANAFAGMINFAQNNIKNGNPGLQWHQDFYDAVKPGVTPPLDCASSKAQSIAGVIEAESFCAMLGIQTETTTDAGGGLNVGWLDVGDWIDFKINVPTAGIYTVTYRVASASSTGQIQFLGSGGTLATTTIPMTGGFQTWVNVTADVNLSAGEQKVRLNISGASFNINWFKLQGSVASSSSTPSSKASLSSTSSVSSKPNGPCANATAKSIAGRVEAEGYCDMLGIQTENTSDTGGGQNVGWLDVGDWVDYYINVPVAGTYSVAYRVASQEGTGQVQFQGANGNTLATTAIPNTGGWQNWTTVYTNVNLPAGEQKIRLFISGRQFNINWFELTVTLGSSSSISSKPSGPCANATAKNIGRIEAEGYCDMQGVQTENTGDTGGGQNVGWLDVGDWVDYYISVPAAGTYSIAYRVATQESTGQVQFQSDNGTTLATTAIPNTGGWQNWTTVNASVNLPAGEQKVRLYVSGRQFNVNWFSLTPTGLGSSSVGSSAASKSSSSVDVGQAVMIEAENFTAKFGSVKAEPCLNDPGCSPGGTGQDLAWIQPGDYTEYDVTLSQEGGYTVEYRIASNLGPTGAISVLQDGNLVTSRNIDVDGGDWQKWTTLSSKGYFTAGKSKLRFAYSGKNFNVNWVKLTFNGLDVTKPTSPVNVVGETGIRDALGNVMLSWTASTDDYGVGKYRIYEGSTLVGETSTTSFPVTGKASGSVLTYSIVAVDRAGNNSSNSSVVTVTIPKPDSQAPSATSVIASSIKTVCNRASFAWNASTDNDAVKVYHLIVNGIEVDKVITSTSFSLDDLTLSATYKLEVYAEDFSKNWSANGGAVMVTMPTKCVLTNDVNVTWSSEVAPMQDAWYKAPMPIPFKLAAQPALSIATGNSTTGTVINVDPSTTYQSMLGVGSSFEHTTIENLLIMSKAARTEVLTTLVDPVNGTGENLFRIPIGTSDFAGTSWYSYQDNPNTAFSIDRDKTGVSKTGRSVNVIQIIKEAQAINPKLKFFGSPWSAPGWMKDSGVMNGGNLLDAHIDDYAEYLSKFVQAYRAEGIYIQALTLENEPGHVVGSMPSMGITPDQEGRVAVSLKKKLKSAGITDCELWLHDHNFDNLVSWTSPIWSNPEYAAAADGSALHDYGGDVSEMTKHHNLWPNKNLYFTERSVWGTDGMAKVIAAFRNWSRSYNFWVTMIDQNNKPNEGPFHADPTLFIKSVASNDAYWATPEVYMVGQFSKFIPTGSLRISSTDVTTELSNIAWLTPDNKIVVVVVNKSSSSQTFTVVKQGKQFIATLPAKMVATYVFENGI